MTSELENLRKQLSEINRTLFDIYNKRQKKIKEIYQVKTVANIPAWDPKRERELFEKFERNFSDSSLGFLAQYSLLIENQLKTFSDYPKWSEAQHILKSSGHIRDFINPVLLFKLNKTEYLKLNLTPDFDKKLTKVLL